MISAREAATKEAPICQIVPKTGNLSNKTSHILRVRRKSSPAITENSMEMRNSSSMDSTPAVPTFLDVAREPECMEYIRPAIGPEIEHEEPTMRNPDLQTKNISILAASSANTMGALQAVCFHVIMLLSCLSPESGKPQIISKPPCALIGKHILNLPSNATNRERLLTMEYAYHSLEDQQGHWNSADEAYAEHRQAQDDHARHRRYRSYVSHPTVPVNRSLLHFLSEAERNTGIPGTTTH